MPPSVAAITCSPHLAWGLRWEDTSHLPRAPQPQHPWASGLPQADLFLGQLGSPSPLLMWKSHRAHNANSLTQFLSSLRDGGGTYGREPPQTAIWGIKSSLVDFTRWNVPGYLGAITKSWRILSQPQREGNQVPPRSGMRSTAHTTSRA